MSPCEAKQIFRGSDPTLQARILARLAHLITIAARDTYNVGGDGVNDPSGLRRFNEVIHRVIGQIGDLLEDDEDRFSEDELLRIIDGVACGGLLATAVSRTVAK